MLYNAVMPGLRTLGERLKFSRVDLRQRRGLPRLSQEALGQALGVSKMAVSHWEANKSAPANSIQKQLADILGVHVGWLIHGEGLSEQTGNGNVRPIQSGGRTVPVVNPTEVARDYDNAIAQSAEALRVISEVGPRAFCVIVWDQSNAPELQIGHAVTIDPDQPTQPGDYCFAAVGIDRRPVMGRLVEARQDGTLIRTVETHNPRWANEPLGDGDVLIGPAVEHTRFLKK